MKDAGCPNPVRLALSARLTPNDVGDLPWRAQKAYALAWVWSAPRFSNLFLADDRRDRLFKKVGKVRYEELTAHWEARFKRMLDAALKNPVPFITERAREALRSEEMRARSAAEERRVGLEWLAEQDEMIRRSFQTTAEQAGPAPAGPSSC